jgi:hypothetical protein
MRVMLRAVRAVLMGFSSAWGGESVSPIMRGD